MKICVLDCHRGIVGQGSKETQFLRKDFFAYHEVSDSMSNIRCNVLQREGIGPF